MADTLSLPTLSLIVAMAQNRVIGKDNALPWHLPDDLKFFKKHTLHKPIIMGRKTFDSIGRPLPNRPNIIISRTETRPIESTYWHSSLKEALTFAHQAFPEAKELMVIGGAQLFKEALPLMNRLYLTIVEAEIEGDIIMPSLPLEKGQLTFTEFHPKDERHAYPFTFQIWDFPSRLNTNE